MCHRKLFLIYLMQSIKDSIESGPESILKVDENEHVSRGKFLVSSSIYDYQNPTAISSIM